MGYSPEQQDVSKMMYQEQMQKNLPVQQTLKTEIHQPVDKWYKLVNTIGESFGYANLFFIFLAGIIALFGFLLRKWLKKKIGEPIKILSDFLNK